jgi:hypothetical protein
MVVLRKFNQCVDRQARKLASLYHQVTNSPTVCAGWAVRIGGEFRRAFRPAARVSAAALYEPTLACSVTAHLESLHGSLF